MPNSSMTLGFNDCDVKSQSLHQVPDVFYCKLESQKTMYFDVLQGLDNILKFLSAILSANFHCKTTVDTILISPANFAGSA